MASSLRQLFDLALEKSQERTTYNARVGNSAGDVSVYENGTLKAGFVWARVMLPAGATETIVRCTKAMPTLNANVLVRKGAKGIYEVTEHDPLQQEAYFTGLRGANVGQHADMHRYFGPDPIVVDPLQYKPLNTDLLSTPGTNVYINKGMYIYNGSRQWFPSETLSLGSYIPGGASTNQRVAVVGIKPSSNTGTVLYSAVSTITTPIRTISFTGSDARLVYNGSPNFVPLTAFRLYGGQTRIDWWDRFEDVRDWITSQDHNANQTISNVSSNGTVASSTTLELINAASSAITRTLLAPSSVAGYEFCFKKVDSTTNTVILSGTIDAGRILPLTKQNQSVTVVSDGVKYQVTAKSFDWTYIADNDGYLLTDDNGYYIWGDD